VPSLGVLGDCVANAVNDVSVVSCTTDQAVIPRAPIPTCSPQCFLGSYWQSAFPVPLSAEDPVKVRFSISAPKE